MIHYSIDTDIRKNTTIFFIILSLIINDYLSPYLPKLNYNEHINLLIGYLPIPTIFTALLFIFDSYLWKWPIINKIVKIPDLNGVWKGELRSSFKCKDIGNCMCEYKDLCSPTLKGVKRNECNFVRGTCMGCINYISDGLIKEVKLKIDQTFTKISVTSYNGMSESTTSAIAGFLIDSSKYGESPMLLYQHENKVDNLDADTGMKSHSGFNELLYDRKEKELSGKYYNDENRGTFGKVSYIKNL